MGEEDKNSQQDGAEKSSCSWLTDDEVKGKREIVLPYKDPRLYASVFFAIAGQALSFVYGWAFLECFITTSMFLVTLFYRQGKKAFQWTIGFAVLDAGFLFGVALYIGWFWKDKVDCRPFYFEFNGGGEDDEEEPAEGGNCENFLLWTGITYVSAVCWATAALCMHLFLRSGKYNEFEKKYTDEFEAAEAANAEAEGNPEVLA